MACSVVLLVLLVFGCASSLPSKHIPNLGGGKIVGGQATTIDKFPYQVSLRNRRSHFCGGAIYRPNIIVTAAHCFYEQYWDALTVVAGTSSRFDIGVSSTVKQIILHPNFDEKSDYDVALLLLDRELVYGPTIQPIALASVNQKIIDGSRAYVSGWGRLQYGGATPTQLQYVAVMTMERTKCAKAYASIDLPITDRMLCAGEERGGKDACQGDSGGPLVLQNKLIGIVSWGEGCAEADYPGVYSNVASLREWIDENVNTLLVNASYSFM